MSSLHCVVRPSQPILGFIRPTPKLTIFPPNWTPSLASTYRFKIGVKFQVNSKLSRNVVFASSSNPPRGSDVVEERENGTAKGPPFLTILAGLLVFAAVYWAVGSIVMWLISLAANLFFK